MISDSIFVSKFEGLSLIEYIDVCCFVCNARHKQLCKNCKLKAEVAKYIVEHGFIAFKMSRPELATA